VPSKRDSDLYAGLIPLHILHHAGEKPVYGLWIIEELGRHGYKLSAGTLYPLLHRLESRGLLRSSQEKADRRLRRVYTITPAGRRALAAAKHMVKELYGELFESELHEVFGHRERRRRQPPRQTATKSAGAKRNKRKKTSSPPAKRANRTRG
jgi:DNA-binding PadR family transcriptional regulator